VNRLARSLFPAAASMAAALIGCATVPHTGRSQLSLFSDDEVQRLGIASYREILSQSEISTDPRASGQVRRVGKRLAAAAEDFLRELGYGERIAGYQWRFTLIEDDETANAWCLPGGKIAVYTGILPYTENVDGLAVVIGHEIAHAIAGHGNERLSQLLLAEMGAVALAAALEDEPETTRALALAAYGLGSRIGILLPYSRTQEYEADRIGLILTARAGYDPREAVPFWKRMMRAPGTEPPEFLATHPATADRIREIERFLPEACSYLELGAPAREDQ